MLLHVPASTILYLIMSRLCTIHFLVKRVKVMLCEIKGRELCATISDARYADSSIVAIGL